MVYFLDDMSTIGRNSQVPSYLHMMQHVYRSKNFEGNTKSISNTDTVLTISAHRHVLCLKGISCKRSVENEANTQHYRKDCASNKFSQKKCEELKATTIKDTRVWRHLETVKENTNIVLQNITLN